MRRAFTLLELLIVIIVIGILATIAVPQFLTAVEKGRIAKAKNALGLIAQAEKMFRAENDIYVDFVDGGANAALGDYIELNQLDVDIDWGYAVADSDADSFQATATRDAGAYEDDIITLNEIGVCGGDHDLRGPLCQGGGGGDDDDDDDDDDG